MALIFTEQEKNYIGTLLEGKIPSEFWCKESILEKLKTDQENADSRQNCEHEYKTYKGTKCACVNCGAWNERSWELED